MGKKIITFMLFFDLLLALVLVCFFDIHDVDLLNSDFSGFLRKVAYAFNQYKDLRIPNIPKIPTFEKASIWTAILNILIFLTNLIVSFLNSVVLLLNLVFDLIKLLEAIFQVIFSFGDYVTKVPNVDSMFKI